VDQVITLISKLFEITTVYKNHQEERETHCNIVLIAADMLLMVQHSVLSAAHLWVLLLPPRILMDSSLSSLSSPL
jgi:hypothetical protein